MADSSFLGGARNKAGMPDTGGLERKRIDEIIEKASKGSKFYEHQKKREQRILEKVEKLTAKKAQLEKMFARDMQLWNKNCKDVETLISEMESERDLTRTIVCVDMDAFFAAVETLDNPGWASIPMAVGGKSMLSTANYEARKYGVVSAMPGYIALKLCPQLLIVEPNFQKYRAAADKFHQVFKKYDPNFSHFSLDEATLDITDKLMETGETSEELVNRMRKEVHEISGLTCSAGIAPNKTLAKIASNVNKPNGQYCVPGTLEEVMNFVKKTPLAKVNGIGKVTAKILGGVLDASNLEQLWEQRLWVRLLFSEIQSNFFLRCSLGIGSGSNGESDYERQSMSTERTFSTIRDLDEMTSVLGDLCQELGKQLEMEGLAGSNVSIKMKASDFTTSTRATTLKRAIWASDDIFSHAKSLLVKNRPTDLRLLGVRLSALESIDSILAEESIENFLVKMEITDAFVKCPICLKSIQGATESGEDSQKLVNEHIDMCLAKGCFSQESVKKTLHTPPPERVDESVPERTAKRPGATMDSFVRKIKR